MSGLRIDKDLCIGCGNCANACLQEALTVDSYAEVDSAKCILCGMCVDMCPVSAISIEKEESGIDKSAYGGVWVCAEYLEGSLHPCALELTGKAHELAAQLETEATAVVLGDESADACASQLSYAGADKVLLVTGERFAQPVEEVWAAALAELVRARKPEILLFGATEFGRSLAPRVAAMLETGLTADCTLLEIDPETKLLRQTRPAFGGNLMATIVCPDRRPQMATCRPGVLPMPELDETRPVTAEHVSPDVPAAQKALLGMVRQAAAGKSITEAKVLVTAGRGVGDKKNVALVRRLAELLGGDYAVSRPLVDMGWAEYPHQVGQTGVTVAPDLLITCGVSGAIQHLAGITGAKTVIAVNTDPDAPIFARADYAVVGDCVQVLKALIQELENGTTK